jgi:myosin heavy subunit
MSNLIIKISLVLLLVLGGVALYLGYELFKQREELKGRTQTLQAGIKRIAAHIEIEEGSDARIASQIVDRELMTLGAMERPIKTVESAAQLEMVRLQATRVELAETKATLAQRERELEATRAELSAAKAEIRALTETIRQKNAQIAEYESTIRELEADKADLQRKAETAQKESEELRATLAAKEADIEVLTLENQKMKERLDPILKRERLQKEQLGKVLFVSPEWNFVILALPHEDTLLDPNLELLVHRGDSLVGKVRVTDVLRQERIAIADILNEWQQMPFERGDSVIY